MDRNAPNWIERIELVYLGFGLCELRIGSRVLGKYPRPTAAIVAEAVLRREFYARNGGAK